jgi:hypothetical protein
MGLSPSGRLSMRNVPLMCREASSDRMVFLHATSYLVLKVCLMSTGTGMCAASGYKCGSASVVDGSSEALGT